MKNLTIEKNILENIWIAFGSLILFTISLPYLFIFASFFPLAFFIFASIKTEKRYFFLVFFLLVTLCALCNFFWIYNNWSYGLKYQRQAFLHHSLTQNIICFAIIYIFMGIYYKTRNALFHHPAILLFCVTLSIVAFPWLGETM